MVAAAIVFAAISAVAAVVTVVFAWKAARGSATATQAAQETGKLAAAASREYVQWRHQDHLRAIGHYVADIAREAPTIEQVALVQAEAGDLTWQDRLQEHLITSMAGMRIDLPYCRALTEPAGARLLAVSGDQRDGLVARMAAAASKEVAGRPELWAPAMDPIGGAEANGRSPRPIVSPVLSHRAADLANADEACPLTERKQVFGHAGNKEPCARSGI
jgi:hypothetical protein